MEAPILVGFTGKAGSGKDHMARVLWKRFGLFPIGFADIMKATLAGREGLPINDMLGNKTAEMRTRLQRYGTEENRHRDPLIWVRHLDAWMRLIMERQVVPGFCVTDVRFRNEAEYIHEMGGVVIWLTGRERKSMTEEQQQHESETDSVPFDISVINSPGREFIAEHEVKRFVWGIMEACPVVTQIV